MNLTSAKLTTINSTPFHLLCGIYNTIEILSSLTNLFLRPFQFPRERLRLSLGGSPQLILSTKRFYIDQTHVEQDYKNIRDLAKTLKMP